MSRNHEFYNQELKEEYIGYRQRTASVGTNIQQKLGAIFKITAAKEAELGKDLCTMTPEELSSAVAPVYSNKERTIKGYFSLIRQYCIWCERRKVPGAVNVVSQVKIEAIEKYKTGHVASPLGLKLYLDKVIPLPERPTIKEIRPRVVLWLGFSGLTHEMIEPLKTSDVNLDNLTIYNKFPIYPEALQDFKLCMQPWFWRAGSPKNPIRYRVDGDLFLRGFKGEVDSIEIYRRSFKDFVTPAIKSGEIPCAVTHNNLLEDGLFYRLYQYEVAGEQLTHANLITLTRDMAIMKGELSGDSDGLTLRQIDNAAYHIRCSIDDGYSLWKDAFLL